MMSILDKIITQKRLEIAERKKKVSFADLENTPLFKRTCFSLSENLEAPGSSGIIAEFKRKSPSKGFINEHANVAAVTGDYTKHGAAGLSVLTDEAFFGGSTADFLAARANEIPMLRKDFIVDEYQVAEAKAMGADVILLIAACLQAEDVQRLAKFAASLGMEILLELHDESEADRICDETLMIGINNRNLKTFKVDVELSLKLSEKIPSGKIKIAESGISDQATIQRFRDAGYKGFLIGETFMKEADPGKTFEHFIKKIKAGI
jgi:indole-3-glycerol phosphate synthase